MASAVRLAEGAGGDGYLRRIFSFALSRFVVCCFALGSAHLPEQRCRICMSLAPLTQPLPDDLLLTLCLVQARRLQRSAPCVAAPHPRRRPHLDRPLFLRLVCHVRRRTRLRRSLEPSYEVTNTSDSPLKKKNIVRELYLAGLASFFLGFGVLFLLLWTGVYV